MTDRRIAVALRALMLAVAMLAGMPLALAACQVPTSRTNAAARVRPLVVQDARGHDVQLYSRSVALVIGQSSYMGGSTGLRPLSSIPKEISDIKTALETNGFDVWTYLDLDSSKLQSTIQCFVDNDLPEDPEMRFVLWFAGHGTTVTDLTNKRPRIDGFVLPIDIKRPPGKEIEVSEVRSKGLYLGRFIDWSKKIVARHALLVFDSCFSGSVLDVPTRTAKSAPKLDPNEKPRAPGFAISEEARQPLREFLTSGTSNEEVPAKSLFAEYFVSILLGERREADQDKDGLLIGSELILFLQESVAQDSYKQTPTRGRLYDRAFDRGEIVFQLPTRGAPDRPVMDKASGAGNAAMTRGYRPVFSGTLDMNRPGPAIVQFFKVEGYAITAANACTDGCETAGKSTRYEIKIEVPANAPHGAVLDKLELRCLSGPCANSSRIVSSPALSADKLSASASFQAWGASSTWALVARLAAPDKPDKVIVFNRRTGTNQELDSSSITISGQIPNVDAGVQKTVDDLVLAMQSDDTPTRRGARVALAKIVDTAPPEVVSQLIRNMALGTYRYQLGVATALSHAPHGWLTGEGASRTMLERARDRLCDGGPCDRTLHGAIIGALANQRLYAYYEVGDNHWMTRAGQLLKLGRSKPPMEAFNTLAAGEVLQAASAVNLRAGSGSASSIVKVVDSGACLTIVQPDVTYADASAQGGWLQVRQLKSCPIVQK